MWFVVSTSTGILKTRMATAVLWNHFLSSRFENLPSKAEKDLNSKNKVYRVESRIYPAVSQSSEPPQQKYGTLMKKASENSPVVSLLKAYPPGCVLIQNVEGTTIGSNTVHCGGAVPVELTVLRN